MNDNKNTRKIDFLVEDPPISNQKYALVSIVGPLMPQKCDVWGLKIRGTGDSMDEVKRLSQKLMRVDNDYDIYTVEVGKFFPLAVEPNAIGNVEYQNEQLNNLMKSYLENRETANEHWTARKNEMVKEAIKEGREMKNQQEHPVSILQRIAAYKERISVLKTDLEAMEKDLQLSVDKFDNNYTEEQKQEALSEFTRINSQATATATATTSASASASAADVHQILNDIKTHQKDLEELLKLKTEMDQKTSPNMVTRMDDNIKELEQKINSLKIRLNEMDKTNVNNYINASYKDSEFGYLTNNVPKTI